MRRDRAARIGTELFLLERAFEDCLDRLNLMNRRFGRALLIGCPDPSWPERLKSLSATVDVRDPGVLFAERAGGTTIVEDGWRPDGQAYDLVLAIGTLDTVNDLPLAFQLIRYSLRTEGLFMGAVGGGDTLPRLRAAMRAADALAGGAAPHVHPRIEPAALSGLLTDAGFLRPVVDVDRIQASYSSLSRLVADLRAMGATNVLSARPRPLSRKQWKEAKQTFGEGERMTETFELLHFAAWAGSNG